MTKTLGGCRTVDEQFDFVKDNIERCIQRYMSVEETEQFMMNSFLVEPEITRRFWRQLEAENAEFFSSFHMARELMHQTNAFNSLLERQVDLMRERGMLDSHTPSPHRDAAKSGQNHVMKMQVPDEQRVPQQRPRIKLQTPNQRHSKEVQKRIKEFEALHNQPPPRTRVTYHLQPGVAHRTQMAAPYSNPGVAPMPRDAFSYGAPHGGDAGFRRVAARQIGRGLHRLTPDEEEQQRVRSGPQQRYRRPQQNGVRAIDLQQLHQQAPRNGHTPTDPQLHHQALQPMQQLHYVAGANSHQGFQQLLYGVHPDQLQNVERFDEEEAPQWGLDGFDRNRPQRPSQLHGAMPYEMMRCEERGDHRAAQGPCCDGPVPDREQQPPPQLQDGDPFTNLLQELLKEESGDDALAKAQNMGIGDACVSPQPNNIETEIANTEEQKRNIAVVEDISPDNGDQKTKKNEA